MIAPHYAFSIRSERREPLPWGHSGTPKIHLGVCGSIAAYKMPDIVRMWQKAGISVSVTLTESAQKFITPLTFEALGCNPVYTSIFEEERSASIFAHLEPGQHADALIVAPASASTISDIACGRADKLLACQALAFHGTGSNLVFAPAMNPHMWANPATQSNAALLQQRGWNMVSPGVGGTACGETGQGRLANIDDIYLSGLKALAPQDMTDVTVMITVGPTREYWDHIRFWSNPSTGVMGASLAVAAWLRGASVHVIAGPGVPHLPTGIFRHDVSSAEEMFVTAQQIWPQANAGIFTAAVADFRPEPHDIREKFKKSKAPTGFDIHFLPNQDILKTLSLSKKKGQKVIGFAAESQDLENAVRRKLAIKKADMIVGNLIDDGFGKADNSVLVADAHGHTERWISLAKPDLAWRILSWMQSI